MRDMVVSVVSVVRKLGTAEVGRVQSSGLRGSRDAAYVLGWDLTPACSR